MTGEAFTIGVLTVLGVGFLAVFVAVGILAWVAYRRGKGD